MLGLGVARARRRLLLGASIAALLFAASEPGLWLDVDPAYLYTDPTGSTLVTTPGQTVGMVLDRSKGLVLGDQRWADASVEFVGASSRITDGVYRIYSPDGANSFARVSLVLTVGTAYEVRLNIDSVTAAASGLRVADAGPIIPAVTGPVRVIWVADNTTAFIKRVSSGSATDIQISGVSFRALPGNHLIQATAASRPTYGRMPKGGVRNLLVATEDFSVAAWSKGSTTITANAGVAPDGSNSAVEALSTGADTLSQNVSVTSGATVTFAKYLKRGNHDWVRLTILNGANEVRAWFNLATGAVGTSNVAGTGVLSGATIESIGNGWYRCALKGSIPSTASYTLIASSAAADASFSRVASGSRLMWHPQAETGSTATAYQRVGSTIYDVTEPTGTGEAQRNLLTWTEDLSQGAWSKTTAGTGVAPVVTPNAAIAPDGTLTADRVVFNAGAGGTTTDRSLLSQSLSVAAGVQHVGAIYARSASGSVSIACRNVGESGFTTITLTEQWQRFSVAETSVDTLSTFEVGLRGNVGSTADVYLWGAQLEVGSTASAYQKVGYAWIGTIQPECHYLQFDGVDDFLVSAANLDMTSTDAVTVIAGVRKESDAASAVVVEHSATIANTGTFGLMAPETAGAGTYRFASRGSAFSSVVPSGYAAPHGAVITGQSDVSSDLMDIRVNGASVASSASDQGTGNYISAPLYIGRRGGTTLPFTGKLFGLVIRGALTASPGAAETLIAANTPNVGTPALSGSLGAPTGTAQVGSTLTAPTGTWTNSPTSYAYQWYADGVAIGGATASTYALTASEQGKVITVAITASNGFGTGAAATSAATGAVAAAPALAYFTANGGTAYLRDPGGQKATRRYVEAEYKLKATAAPPAGSVSVLSSIYHSGSDNQGPTLVYSQTAAAFVFDTRAGNGTLTSQVQWPFAWTTGQDVTVKLVADSQAAGPRLYVDGVMQANQPAWAGSVASNGFLGGESTLFSHHPSWGSERPGNWLSIAEAKLLERDMSNVVLNDLTYTGPASAMNALAAYPTGPRVGTFA